MWLEMITTVLAFPTARTLYKYHSPEHRPSLCVLFKTQIFGCKILGFHGAGYEECHILENGAVWVLLEQ
jgi:hypothetical protein